MTNYEFPKIKSFRCYRSSKPIIELCNQLRAILKRGNGVCAVHCDSSVGRTGVLIGLMKIMEEVDANKREIDVFKTVFEMRAARMKMARTHGFVFDAVPSG